MVLVMLQQDDHKLIAETKLADSDKAVFDLLESLLMEIDEHVETDEETELKIAEVLPIQEIEEPVEAKVEAEIEFYIAAVVDTKTETSVVEEDVDALPEWTNAPFSCLIVELEGIEIAIPLLALNSIAKWDQETISIPHQPDWHLGMVRYRDENIFIIDLARIILPHKLEETAEQRRENHGSHFLVLKDNLALSCNGIKEIIKLSPEEVRWRSKVPTKSWAMGTLVEKLSVLLDTNGLIREIEQN